MNTTLIKLADITARLLATHPDAPPIAAVRLTGDLSGGWMVSLQLPGTLDRLGRLWELVVWAELFGTCVSFTDQDTFVDVCAVTTVDGVRVEVWSHLGVQDAIRLTGHLGIDLERSRAIEVTTRALSTALDTLGARSAMVGVV